MKAKAPRSSNSPPREPAPRDYDDVAVTVVLQSTVFREALPYYTF